MMAGFPCIDCESHCRNMSNDPACIKCKADHTKEKNNKSIRTFDSGATRDSDESKPDYEGFICPLALRRYADYMNRHRVQSDGNLRPSDNWQKGIPTDQYMKSMLRHVMDAWTINRGYPVLDAKDGHPVYMDEALCAILFNAFGYLHEIMKPHELFVGAANEEQEIQGNSSSTPESVSSEIKSVGVSS